MKGLLRYMLFVAALMWSVAAWSQYNPTNPPEPDEPVVTPPVTYYTLTLQYTPAASVTSVSPGASTQQLPGASVTVRANIASNFTFEYWEQDGDTLATTSTFVYTMPAAAATLVAHCRYTPGSPGEPDMPDIPDTPDPEPRSRVYVDVTPDGAGRVNGVTDGESYVVGTVLNISAAANSNFTFVEWTADGATYATTSSFSYTVGDSDVHFTASFRYTPGSPSEPDMPDIPEVRTKARVFVEVTPVGAGTISGVTSGESYDVGTELTIKASTNSGFVFANWSASGVELSTSATFKYTVPADDSYLKATFTYTPGSPGEPGEPTGTAGMFALQQQVEPGQDYEYPVYFENHQVEIRGFVIDVTVPDGFNADMSALIKGDIISAMQVSVDQVGERTYRVTGLGEEALNNFNDCMFRIPMHVPDTIRANRLYDVTLAHGVLTLLNDSQTPCGVHSGGLLWYVPMTGICNKPSIAFDGRTVSISADAGDVVYYSLDGKKPTGISPVYTEPFMPDTIVEIRAVARSDIHYDSEEAVYLTPALWRGEGAAIVAVPGNLRVAFGWTDPDAIEYLEVTGTPGEGDFAFLSSMTGLRTLGLRTAQPAEIPDRAFAGSPMLYVEMPDGPVARIGDDIFADCPNLATVKWLDNVPDGAFRGIANSNLLLYMAQGAMQPSAVRNVVVDGHSDVITLSDGGNFYVPEPFEAGRIVYSHEYTQRTAMSGETAGWETIALPFAPTEIVHEARGVAVAPFASAVADENGYYWDELPFWLYSLGADGWTEAPSIEAYTPYLIAMPNNEEYADRYILGGTVRFAAADVAMAVTTQHVATKGDVAMVPTTLTVAAADTVYTLNVGDTEGTAGSRFERGVRAAEPFQAYLTSNSGAAALGVRELGDAVSGVESVVAAVAPRGLRVWTRDGVLYVASDTERHIEVCDVAGRTVAVCRLTPGVTAIPGLPAGIYFLDHHKLLLSR